MTKVSFKRRRGRGVTGIPFPVHGLHYHDGVSAMVRMFYGGNYYWLEKRHA